jgi:hypothetical protein
MTTFAGEGQPIRLGDVRQVRELKRGVQAQVCLGASAVHGSAVVTVETASPAVLKALAALKAALRDDALALYQAIQSDQPQRATA